MKKNFYSTNLLGFLIASEIWLSIIPKNYVLYFFFPYTLPHRLQK